MKDVQCYELFGGISHTHKNHASRINRMLNNIHHLSVVALSWFAVRSEAYVSCIVMACGEI